MKISALLVCVLSGCSAHAELPAHAVATPVPSATATPTPPSLVLGNGAPRNTGRPLADEIDAVIRRHERMLRFCYERERLKNPSLAGRLMVTFKIDARGDVITVRVKRSTLANASLEQCLVERFRKMRFRATGEEVTVVYPLLFHAE